ncbi:DNA-directed RNA polymerase subunit beta-like [Microplitis mediator]|uniref:DNA-directed RNA polymerase subunit beta-like n=1 Tax=Microplitis mediator TaxID=375433 RepID=UPI0025577DC1|nr:DNA-directed RNA polymerase subunit beta-like [Microplitis mediator]
MKLILLLLIVSAAVMAVPVNNKNHKRSFDLFNYFKYGHKRNDNYNNEYEYNYNDNDAESQIGGEMIMDSNGSIFCRYLNENQV